MSLISLAILLFRMAEESIGSLYMLLFIVLGCFLLELSYRTLTGRKMGEFIDSGLKKREKNLAEWESWVKNFAKNLSKLVEDVEIYLVGSHARGEKEKSHDVDLLVFSDKLDYSQLEEAKRNARLSKYHPLHLHIESRKKRDEALRRAKRSIRIEP